MLLILHGDAQDKRTFCQLGFAIGDWGHSCPGTPSHAAFIALHIISLSTSFTPTTNMSSNVSFGNVTIYEFSVAIGDSPSSTSGLPVCLNQLTKQRAAVSINEFEGARARYRRSCSELKMSPQQRLSLLRKSGFVRKDLMQAERALAYFRLQSSLAKDIQHQKDTTRNSVKCLRSAKSHAGRRTQISV